MDLRRQMDSVYREMPAERIPWNLEAPPELLVDLVETRTTAPGAAVDIGCGCGNYTVWLAAQGFRATGLDLSPEAIALADKLARERGVECRFAAADVTGDVSGYEEAFDLGFDWEMLHHVFPEQRQAYAGNLYRMLRPGATHLSVSFSEEDPDFGGSGKYRETPLGTTLYFSSEEEIEKLFSPKFRVRRLETTEIAGKYGPHRAVSALLERR